MSLDEDEMFDVARTFNPDLTREEFAKQWKEFLELKEDRRRKLEVQ